MSLRDLPDVFTIPEAAVLLRIARTTAYGQARLWRETGGREGLPVLTLGRRLFVSKAQLERLLGGEIAGNGGSPTAGTASRGPGCVAPDTTVSREEEHDDIPDDGAAPRSSSSRPRSSASSPRRPEPSQLTLFNPEPSTPNPSR